MTPQEFAKMCADTQDCRETSWDDRASRYDKTYLEAASECCPAEWAEIVAVLLFPGYADVWDWVYKTDPSLKP